jgi:hypothetical protein
MGMKNAPLISSAPYPAKPATHRVLLEKRSKRILTEEVDLLERLISADLRAFFASDVNRKG